MDTRQMPPARARQHPLLIVAALAVILFCAVGTAAIMGWLPSTKGSRDGLTEADRVALAANLQQPAQPLAVAPGVTAPGAVNGAMPTYPADAPATAYAPGAYPAQSGAQAYAAQEGAYGTSAATGASGAGYAAVPAAAASPQYAPAEPVRESHRKAKATAANDDGRWCSACGNVESIRTITHRAQGSGVGAAGGAILGGLLGNQVGGGHGRQLATVAGAVGGAVVGNQVEGNMRATTSYQIRVRLDDGTLRTFHQNSAPRWRNGDRVRIVKGSLRAA